LSHCRAIELMWTKVRPFATVAGACLTTVCEPPLDMDFTYELVGPGWARAEIRHGNQIARLTVSYLSNALSDLLDGVQRVLGGAEVAEFVWWEEPGEYRWRFETIDGVTVLSITSTSDIRREEHWNDDGWDIDLAEEGGPDVVEFRAECDMAELAGAIVVAARSLIAKDGEAGYLHRWIEHPFPMSKVNAVEAILSKRDK
jgi:hypothetical protein